MTNQILIALLLAAAPGIGGCSSHLCSDVGPNARARYVDHDIGRRSLELGVIQSLSSCGGESTYRVYEVAIALADLTYQTRTKVVSDFDVPGSGDASRLFEGECRSCSISVEAPASSTTEAFTIVLESRVDEIIWDGTPLVVELRDTSETVALRLGFGKGDLVRELH